MCGQQTFFVLVLIGAFLLPCGAYRFLAIFPFNGKSHHMMFQALLKGLLARNHEVHEISHFPLKHQANYKSLINLNGTLDSLVNNYTVNIAKHLGDDGVPFIATKYGNRLCDLMGLQEMQDFIKSARNGLAYDAVITESFGANCYMGFGHLLRIPLIAVSSSAEYPWAKNHVMNDDNHAFVSTIFTQFSKDVTFWERLRNIFVHWNSIRRFNAYTQNEQTAAMRKYLSPDVPNIRDVEQSVALFLVNAHPLINGVKPVVPALVQVAGLHVEENKEKLSKSLQKWMDKSNDGVVFFTLGSMVLIETLPKDILYSIYETFEKIKPIKVLMKIVNVTKLPSGLPDNVLTLPWIPQVPVLAHKNTKVFITHGGLMGCQEALYFGVPMIGIPIFADQPRNIGLFTSKNMSLMINLDEITENSFSSVLQEVLNNKMYRENAKYNSQLFRDRPMSAMDTAAFWINYVIRHGPQSIKSKAFNYTWWQLALIDVYLFVFTCFVFVLFLFIYVVRIILRKFKYSLNSGVHSRKMKSN